MYCSLSFFSCCSFFKVILEAGSHVAQAGFPAPCVAEDDFRLLILSRSGIAGVCSHSQSTLG